MTSNKENSTTYLPFRNFFINAYILPGFLFLLATCIVCYLFRLELETWTMLRTEAFESFIEPEKFRYFISSNYSLIFQLLLVAVILFISLIFGNAILVLGSLIFDTIYMGKGIGWPYERILSFYPKKYGRRALNLLLFTVLNVIAILFISDTWIHTTEDFFLIMSVILLLYLIKDWLLTPFIKWFIGKDEDIISFFEETTKEKKRPRIYERAFILYKYLMSKKKVKKSTSNRVLVTIAYVASLVVLLDLVVYLTIVLGKFFGLSHGMEDASRKRFMEKYKKVTGFDTIENNPNVYWYSYITLSIKNPEHIRIANSHLKRSILLRNLATTGLIMVLILFILKPEMREGINVKTFNYDTMRWKYWSGVWYFASYLLFIGYNHVLHKYFTKYLIRCFIIDDAVTKNS